MPLLDFRSVAVADVGPAARTKLFGANSYRVLLIVSATSTGVAIGLANRPGTNPNGVWVYIDANRTVSLPYRDFGPVIKEEVWFTTNVGGGQIVIGHEVFTVPRS